MAMNENGKGKGTRKYEKFEEKRNENCLVFLDVFVFDWIWGCIQ